MAKKKVAQNLRRKNDEVKKEEMRKKEESEQGKKKLKRKQEKQIRMFVIAMLGLLIFIFIIYAFIQESLNFQYAGLEFEKLREGDLILYKTPTFPIFLREDPRKLKDIDIKEKIMLQKKIGIGSEKSVFRECEDTSVATTSLAIFFGKSSLEPFSATKNKTEAEKFNITYVECGHNSDYSVIWFEKGEENKIKKQGDCYILEVKDCEVLNLAERFIVASYAHSRGIYI